MIANIRHWRIITPVIFLETHVFTRQVLEAMDDESYRGLQSHLAAHPESGDLIRGSGGLRKIRWSGAGRGKQGGTRTIYYWDSGDMILMLFLYKKNERSDLTSEQLSVLRKIVGEFKDEKGKV